MITSVYLSKNKLTVITGRPSLNPALSKFNKLKKITLKKQLSFEVPETLYAGGLILNPDGLAEYLKRLWAENSLPKTNISLVLGRSGFINRLFDMPLLSSVKTIEYLPREFAEVGRYKDPIFSYTVLSENRAARQRRVLGLMSERLHIKNFADVFIRAGLALISIDTVQASAVRLLSKHPSIKGRTCLVQLIEENELTSLLFLSGSFVYSDTSRLTQPIEADITRSVNGILQFARSQDTEHPLTDIYISGADKETYMLCEQSINQSAPYLTVGELSSGPFINETEAVGGPASGAVRSISSGKNLICPVSGFDMLAGKANLLYRQRRSMGAEARKRALIRYSLPFFLVILIYLISFFILHTEYGNLTSLIDKAAVYINSEEAKDAVALYGRYRAELDDINARTTDAERAAAAIDSYPLMNSAVCGILKGGASGYADIAIVSYDAATGLVGLKIAAEDETLIHSYVEILRNEDILARVEYRGYDLNEDGSYKVNLSCFLSAEAGRAAVYDRTGRSESGSGDG